MLKYLTLLLFFTPLFVTPNHLEVLDVNTILQEGDRIITPPNIRGVFNLKLISANKDVREIRAEAYQKQQSDIQENRVFIFYFPPSVKGTGFLVHSFFDKTDNRMWMYLPAVRRIKRIALDTAGGGYFMGSDFTYSDLISRSSDDYYYELLGEKELNGEPCYLIKSYGKTKAKQRSMGYLFTLNYYRKKDFLIVGIDYYDMAGDLLKEYRVHKAEILSEYLFPSKVIMSNVQTGHISIIEFTELVVEDIPDEYFTHFFLREGKK